ncbi:MAG: S8/S53 family peptidase [Nocardioides sp.]|nr:S8/S53 family peptidase [Nocardioides sp.]
MSAVAAAGALCAVSLTAAGQAQAAGNAATSGRHHLAGSKPVWESNPNFKKVGEVADGASVHAKVWLSPNNAADLTALAKAVSDPSSSQYGQYLSHSEYVSRFAPTQAQLDSVRSWLTGDGLRIDSVGPDNHYVSVSGTVAQAEAAFGTNLAKFHFATGTVRAPATELSVPASVGGTVLAVTGLTPAGHMVTPGDLGAPAGFVNATPCSTYYGEKKATSLPKLNGRTLPYAPCGYTPSQLRGAYGISGTGLTGAGQTVAITDAFDASTLRQDTNTYATRHGDPAFRQGQFSDISFGEGDTDVSPTPIQDCGGNGWYGEQTLDVEAVHAMAPAANVQYVGAASCYDADLLASLSKITQLNQASIVTNSWGEPTVIANDPADGCTPSTPCLTIDQTLVDAYESVFQQGAVQGIGFYFSSGDSGDEGANTGYIHPDYPAGDPWVTSVGGTSLGVGDHNQHLFETGWGTARWNLTSDGSSWQQTVPFLYGAGGGYSQIFAEPSYQRGVVKQDPTRGRAVPDIAMDADPTTGMLVGETQNFALPSVFGPAGVHYGEYRIGGTSLASPLLAGAQAVAQQRTHGRLGFADPLIYSLAKGTSSVFYDVTPATPDAGNIRADFVNGYNADGGLSYTIRTFDQDSSLTTGRGWDDVTGVGTFTPAYLAALGGKGHGRR